MKGDKGQYERPIYKASMARPEGMKERWEAMKNKDEGENRARFNNVGQFIVTRADLPLSCPMQDEPLWDAHPRVYLPIEEAGRVICPYCSAEYILEEEKTFE